MDALYPFARPVCRMKNRFESTTCSGSIGNPPFHPEKRKGNRSDFGHGSNQGNPFERRCHSERSEESRPQAASRRSLDKLGMTNCYPIAVFCEPCPDFVVPLQQLALQINNLPRLSPFASEKAVFSPFTVKGLPHIFSSDIQAEGVAVPAR